MAQDLTVNIKTTSDVPQAMDKAKAAAGSFDKQVQDIGMKFKTAFKDIALGFVAPMIILQGVISAMSSAIAKAKQDAKDGLDLLAKGETVYASSEEKKMAAFFKAKKEREAEEKMAKEGKRAIAGQFINTKEGLEIAKKIGDERGAPITDELDLLMMPSDPEFQKRALKAFLESEEGKAYKPIFEDKPGKDTQFKGPEGFSNVVGVGANPVMEAMNAQLEEQRKQTALLEKIAGDSWQIPPDFTKSTATPSRASMLTK
jgi:hypothetical protein